MFSRAVCVGRFSVAARRRRAGGVEQRLVTGDHLSEVRPDPAGVGLGRG
jgi:hypothetical protein